jgi:hypothetical protein
VWFARPAIEGTTPPGYWISPSNAAVEWPDLQPLRIVGTESIGTRLQLGPRGEAQDDVIGNTVHAFLAADVPGLSRDQRVACADRLAGAAGLRALLPPEVLLQAGDQLRSWVESRWPGATWRREYPITEMLPTPRGARRVLGTIDLLLETGDGVVILDHKSYLGAFVHFALTAGVVEMAVE